MRPRQWTAVLVLPALLAVAAGLAACAPGAAPPDYSKTPVVFVHGTGMNSSSWDVMIRHLVRAGYPREYLAALDLVPNNGSNVLAAEQQIAPAALAILDRVQLLSERAGCHRTSAKVDIVAHSMGAVSSRWFAARNEPERLRIWISLAGANHGTDALVGFGGVGDRELVPAFANSMEASRVQVLLNGTPAAPVDETPFGLGVDRNAIEAVLPDQARAVAYFTISISLDRWIVPESSAWFDGAGGLHVDAPAGTPAVETSPGNYQFRGRTDHDRLIRNRRAICLGAAILSAPSV